VRKAGKPVCVVVDEVDGVVGGSGGGGEGGFVKALIDLINLDEKNSKMVGQQQSTSTTKKRKGDKFRLLRPLILICNDLYHPSVRPLRQSSMAEIVHIRKPALTMVANRMQDIFVKEGIQCDSDGVRRLCEATWGVSTKKEGGSGNGTGEGDIRGVMVVSEWVAGRLRSSHDTKSQEKPHLSRKWIEDNFINDLRHGGGSARSLGRGGAKDVVERVFKEGAGFPKQAETTDVRTAAARAKAGVIGVAEGAKRRAMDRLREMVDTSGDCDRIVTGKTLYSTHWMRPFAYSNIRLLHSISRQAFPRRHSSQQTLRSLRMATLPRHTQRCRPRLARMGTSTLPVQLSSCLSQSLRLTSTSKFEPNSRPRRDTDTLLRTWR